MMWCSIIFIIYYNEIDTLKSSLGEGLLRLTKREPAIIIHFLNMNYAPVLSGMEEMPGWLVPQRNKFLFLDQKSSTILSVFKGDIRLGTP